MPDTMTLLPDALALAGDGIACTSAIIVLDGKVLLGLRHYQNKWEGELPTNSLWTTPGGRSDAGETLGECLVRETKEETALTVAPVAFWGCVPGAKAGDNLYIFQCTIKSGELQNVEDHKFGEWGWFPIDQIPEPFINTHARSIIQEKGRV